MTPILKDTIESLSTDAERWRFLVAHAFHSIEGKHLISWLHDGVWTFGSFNAAIDHAMGIALQASEAP